MYRIQKPSNSEENTLQVEGGNYNSCFIFEWFITARCTALFPFRAPWICGSVDLMLLHKVGIVWMVAWESVRSVSPGGGGVTEGV
jgi:hypothetical protein